MWLSLFDESRLPLPFFLWSSIKRNSENERTSGSHVYYSRNLVWWHIQNHVYAAHKTRGSGKPKQSESVKPWVWSLSSFSPRSWPLPQLVASRGSGLPGGIGDFILSIAGGNFLCCASSVQWSLSKDSPARYHFSFHCKCSRCGKKDLFFFFFSTCVTCAMLPWCQTSRPQSASVTYTVAKKTWSYQLGWIQS